MEKREYQIAYKGFSIKTLEEFRKESESLKEIKVETKILKLN